MTTKYASDERDNRAEQLRRAREEEIEFPNDDLAYIRGLGF